MLIKNILFAVGLVVCSTLIAKDDDGVEEEQQQLPPETEVHLFELDRSNGRYNLSNGKNISNNKGYDNQPYFTSDNKKVLYVSMRDEKQTDIYQYDLKKNKSIRLTNSTFSEYSPKTLDKNESITFVSEGGDPDQSVWQMNIKTSKYSWILNTKEPVGYYHVNQSNNDILFWSRYGWSLQYSNVANNVSRFVIGNAIPSSPQQVPNSNQFSFVHRQTNGEIWIKAFDPSDFSITPLAPIPGHNYEYAWSPNGDMLRVEKNILYAWKGSADKSGWQKQQNLRHYFKGQISRLAVSSNQKYIALVENL